MKLNLELDQYQTEELERILQDVMAVKEENSLSFKVSSVVLNQIYKTKMFEFWGEPVYTYTSNEAVEDGILISLDSVKHQFHGSVINLVTRNLMNLGYFSQTEEGETVNIPNLNDLLFQCFIVLRNYYSQNKKNDDFYDFKVEFPDGMKRRVFLALNETGRYTLMLPEDN